MIELVNDEQNIVKQTKQYFEHFWFFEVEIRDSEPLCVTYGIALS